MKINEITFNRIYQKVINNLKKTYNKAGSVFTLASPSGHILQTLTQLFQTNMLYLQNVQNTFDLSADSIIDDKQMRTLAKIGQYNPSRSSAAFGSIKLMEQGGVNINEEIKGSSITFTNYMNLKNIKNNLNYTLDLGQDKLTFSLLNNNAIILNVIQGEWKTDLKFTGTGEINQSFTVPAPKTGDIDNYKFKIYVNSELWQVKKHKFDLLPNEKACVVYTSFTGGIDIIFGNNNEGLVPNIGDIIEVHYLETVGTDGNLIDTQINDFQLLDYPIDEYGNEINISNIFDIDIYEEISFGSNGDTTESLKQILPYASSNFLLARPEQYKFFLERLNIFSTIDVYTSERSNNNLINEIYKLIKTNTDLLNKVNNDDNTSSLKQIINNNLQEIIYLRKLLLTNGGDGLINILLIPDITTYYNIGNDTNYFTINEELFKITEIDKKRVLNYLSNEGIQVITNEVNIVDTVIKKYLINITVRIYDDVRETNVINEIIDTVSDYFIYQMRRDRIPPSDIIRLLDTLHSIDSVDVEFISKDNEDYHKEFLIKATRFKLQNKREPEDTEIIMSDGKPYVRNKTIGLDPILGDILIDKNEIPIIRGGFTDRYNNKYNVMPGDGGYSSINILILPEKTRRK